MVTVAALAKAAGLRVVRVYRDVVSDMILQLVAMYFAKLAHNRTQQNTIDKSTRRCARRLLPRSGGSGGQWGGTP